jgi:arylsulfatase A-like enzyme
MADKPRVYQRMRQMHWDQLPQEEVRDAIRRFWAYCSYLDDLLGRVLACLDATGQADETLLLYVADHGDYCGDHGLFTKGIPCFRGAYHIPAVIRWPAGVAAGSPRRVDELVSLADFAPTFVELAGGEPAAGLVGRSLAPFLRGERPAGWRDAIHTQTHGNEVYFTQRSVATKDWKYVFNAFDVDELYDLRRDPHEMTNLAGRAEHEAVLREMAGRMWRFAASQDDPANCAYIATSLAPYGPGEAFRP